MTDLEKTNKTLIPIAALAITAAFLIGALVGLIGGLLYGWVINPVECVDALPSQLRGDLQRRYISLVIDSYILNNDLESASSHLSFWGNADLIQILREQLDQAVREGNILRTESIRDILTLYGDPIPDE